MFLGVANGLGIRVFIFEALCQIEQGLDDIVEKVLLLGDCQARFEMWNGLGILSLPHQQVAQLTLCHGQSELILGLIFFQKTFLFLQKTARFAFLPHQAADHRQFVVHQVDGKLEWFFLQGGKTGFEGPFGLRVFSGQEINVPDVIQEGDIEGVGRVV